MIFLKKKGSAAFLALLTGAAMTVGFPPYVRLSFSWMPFLAFAPLAWVLFCAPLAESKSAQRKKAFLLGFLAGYVFFLMTLHWITSVAWEGALLLPLYLALYPAVWALFVTVVARPLRGSLASEDSPSSVKNLVTALLAAAAWTGLEWVKGILFTGFGWNSFGVAFHRNIPFIQIADVVGVGGLSFLGVFTGCIAAMSVQRLIKEIKNAQPGRSKRHLHLDIALTLLLLVFVMSYGLRELLAPALPGEKLSIAAVQGNIPQNHKWDRAFEEEIMRTYLEESRMALALHPDLVVWPEAATPRPLLRDKKIFEEVRQVMAENHADFLIGSLHYEDAPPKDYNAAILLTEQGEVSQFYAKTHLVPFGEYIPFRKTFPLFQWIVGDRVLGDFNAGSGPHVLELGIKPMKIGTLLCFEDTLGNLVRGFAAEGAQLLITLTNDGWFGHTAASQQHVVNALFRSVETKLPLLRAANTGVTCVIDRFGRVIETLHDSDGSTFLEGVLSTQIVVPAHPIPTFYTKHGDLFAKVCLGVTLLSLLLGAFLKKRLFL